MKAFSRGCGIASLNNLHARGSVNCLVTRQKERGIKTWADLHIRATDG